MKALIPLSQVNFFSFEFILYEVILPVLSFYAQCPILHGATVGEAYLAFSNS